MSAITFAALAGVGFCASAFVVLVCVCVRLWHERDAWRALATKAVAEGKAMSDRIAAALGKAGGA